MNDWLIEYAEVARAAGVSVPPRRVAALRVGIRKAATSWCPPILRR